MIIERDWIVRFPFLAAFLWSLGGAGVIWIRRFFLPALFILLLIFLYKQKWYKCLILLGLLVGVSTLGYGDYIEHKNIFMLSVVGIAYGIPGAVYFCLNYYKKIKEKLPNIIGNIVICLVTWLGVVFLSNWAGVKGWEWGWSEGFTGLVVYFLMCKDLKGEFV